MKKKSFIFCMVGIILIRILIYLLYKPYYIETDTISYIQAMENILQGKLDIMRTPVYPIFMLMGKLIIVVQEIVSLISVIFVYKILKKVTQKQYISCALSLIYGILPCVFTYNRVLLTESFAISFSIIFLYFLISDLQTPKLWKKILLTALCIFMIFLRPSFLYLLIVLAIIWSLQLNKALVLLSLVVLAIIGYSYVNQLQNGYFGLSVVTEVNKLDTIIGMGIYETGQDNEIIEIIEKERQKNSGPWYRKATYEIRDLVGWDGIKDYNSRCTKEHLGEYIVGLINRTIKVMQESCIKEHLPLKNGAFVKLYIPFIFIFVYEAITSIFIIKKWIFSKKIPWEMLCIHLIILGNLVVITIGAQAEWARLFVPSLALILISIGMQINSKGEQNEIKY